MAVAFLSGCDPATGVRRSVRLDAMPPTASVRAALQAVPEVEDVRYRKVPSSTSWSLYEGTVVEPPFDQFAYRGSEAEGTLEVRATAKGEKRLRLYYVEIGAPLSRAVVDRVRALMDKIYASLRAHVPEVPPAAEIREELIRVRD